MSGQSPFARFGAAFLTYLMTADPQGFRDFVRTKSLSDLLSTYDFIIVGAGSAGSTLANRLSENCNWNILLLEAGGQENHFSRTPLVSGLLSSDLQFGFDWNYTTTKQTRTCLGSEGKCPYPRGRALGGSSATNGMIYVRGYRSDYNRWGVDNPGWSFKDVFPYFLKSEGNRIPGLVGHGRTGPLTVTRASYSDEIGAALLQGGIEMGWRNTDCQKYEDSCIEYTQSTIRDGRRCSASTAYLEPISGDRDNLHILTGATVDKILIENNIATGVQFTINNKSFRVGGSKEIILSAGAINSPKILMLSGIGARDHLEPIGIPVVADLPVGNNLQDHLIVVMRFHVRNGTSTTLEGLVDEQQTYVENQTGPLSYSGVELLAWNSLRECAPPIVQYHIATIPYDNIDGVTIATAVVRPQSRGTVRLDPENPTGKPLIDLNYLSHPSDRELTEKGIMDAIKLMETAALGAYNPKIVPPSQCNDTESLRELVACSIKYRSATIYHPVGTVKMGPISDGGVVSNQLKVYGIQRLRVVDASIAPTIISMNTNAMAIMIGEKCADMVKEEYLVENLT